MATKKMTKKPVAKKRAPVIEAWEWSGGIDLPSFFTVRVGTEYHGLYVLSGPAEWRRVPSKSAISYIASFGYVKLSREKAAEVNQARLKGVRPW